MRFILSTRANIIYDKVEGGKVNFEIRVLYKNWNKSIFRICNIFWVFILILWSEYWALHKLQKYLLHQGPLCSHLVCTPSWLAWIGDEKSATISQKKSYHNWGCFLHNHVNTSIQILVLSVVYKSNNWKITEEKKDLEKKGWKNPLQNQSY